MKKTEGMWLGNKRMSNENPLPITWTNKVKVLGIVFSYDEKLATSLNFDGKIISLKQTLALWKSRDLTAFGKIVIVKIFGLSKFLYMCQVRFLTIQRQINSIIHKFIWNGPDKIKRSVIRSNYDEGGLKMMDIYSRIKAQHIMWVKRLFF